MAKQDEKLDGIILNQTPTAAAMDKKLDRLIENKTPTLTTESKPKDTKKKVSMAKAQNDFDKANQKAKKDLQKLDTLIVEKADAEQAVRDAASQLADGSAEHKEMAVALIAVKAASKAVEKAQKVSNSSQEALQTAKKTLEDAGAEAGSSSASENPAKRTRVK